MAVDKVLKNNLYNISEEYLMRIIDWNISWASDIRPKIEYLKNQIRNTTFIIILQEVKPSSYKEIKESFAGIANIEYSLAYRAPSKFDTDSRKLGVTILVSKNMNIKNATVLERAIMPDRTLMVDVDFNGKSLRILGLHSLTGCQHGKAKEIQYFSFAEAIDSYKPDIVGIDANEPQIDHYDISKMKFFDNYQKGNGCKAFFETMQQNSLIDSFIKNYDISQYADGKCLTTSHIIKRGNKKVRYDFVFINNDKIKDYLCEYDYNGAISAGSDHAAIILNLGKHNSFVS